MTRYHKRPFQNNPSGFQIFVDHLRFTLVLSEQWVLTFRGLSIANISCCLSDPLVRAQRFTQNFKDKIASISPPPCLSACLVRPMAVNAYCRIPVDAIPLSSLSSLLPLEKLQARAFRTESDETTFYSCMYKITPFQPIQGSTVEPQGTELKKAL